MKKVFATLLAASMMLMGTQAFAQISVGAGYLNSTQSGKVNDKKQDSVNSNGFYVGASYNIPLVAGLAVAPGVYYSFITNKDENSTTALGITASGSSTFTEQAINIPVNFNYGYDLAPDMRAFVFAGPTFQYGLSSKTKVEGSVSGLGSSSSTINNYDDDSNYGRFNIYLGGGIGMDIANTFQVTVGYDYGLMNLYTGDADKTSIHRSNIKLGVAYLF